MEAQKAISQDDLSSCGAQASQNSRSESIQRCISSLVHSSQCRDENCRKLSCHKMKRVVTHTKVCKRRQTGPCPICKQLVALCCCHAKECREQNCLVPFCPNIRQKFAEQAAPLNKKRREMVRRLTGGQQQQPQAALQNGVEAMVSCKDEENTELPPFVSRTFTRRIVLPKDVDRASITCKLTNDGVLYIEAGKNSLEIPEERAIPIQVGAAQSHPAVTR